MTQPRVQMPLEDIFGRSGMPTPPPRRQLGQTVLGPDPRTITASLLPDRAPPILGRLDAGNHFLFTVPGSVTGGFHTRAEAFGYQPQLIRHRDSQGRDIPIETLNGVELPLVQMATEAPSPPVVVARTGLVRVDRKVILDDTGIFHPFGASFFWALQAWKRDRDRFKRNAEFLAGYGLDYFRILCEVGTSGNPSSSWAGNTIDPTTPEWFDYQEMLAGLLDWCSTQLGLRLELTVLGKGTVVDPVRLSRPIADVIADGRQHMVLDVEMVNEFSSGTSVSIATMQEMAAVFKAAVPNLLALSNPGEGDEWDAIETATKASGLHGFTVHLRRKNLDQGWAHVRQGYDCKNTRLAVLNNEPAGPGSSVEQQTDVLQLVMTRLVSVMCGGAAYVFHSGTGVYGDGKAHVTAGKRPANFSEIPNIDAMLTALRAADALLPVGVENWAVKNTQRAGVPFDLPKSAHWGAGNEDSSGFGVNKAYAAVAPDGRFIQLPCGVKMAGDKPCPMEAQFNMKDVTVFDPSKLPALVPVPGLEGRQFAQGEKLPVPGRADGKTASIIRGQKA